VAAAVAAAAASADSIEQVVREWWARASEPTYSGGLQHFVRVRLCVRVNAGLRRAWWRWRVGGVRSPARARVCRTHPAWPPAGGGGGADRSQWPPLGRVLWPPHRIVCFIPLSHSIHLSDCMAISLSLFIYILYPCISVHLFTSIHFTHSIALSLSHTALHLAHPLIHSRTIPSPSAVATSKCSENALIRCTAATKR